MFYTLYNYFKNKKLFLAIIIILVSSAAIYTALKIHTTEDISKMIPVDDELKRFNFANEHIKLNDKIIINVSLKDTTKQNTDYLSAYADSLTFELKNLYNEHISEIKNTVENQTINELYEIFYQNLPIFLIEQDYEKIDTLLSDSELKKTLNADFRTLISPASMVTKKFIKRDPLSLTPIALKRLQKLQLDDSYEIIDSHIFTKDRNHLFLFIVSNYSNNETGKNKQLIEGINKTIKSLNTKFREIHVEIFGAPVISVGNAERIKKDIILTVSIAVSILFLFLSLFYKRFDIFFIIFLPAAFGAAVSIAFLYLLKGEVSAISLGIGSVLVGISIDYSLHIFTHFRSKSKVSEIFKDVSIPILMSSITTAAAFFCLLFVSSDALKDLGLFAGISVIAAAIFALIILPHFLKKKNKFKSPKEHKNLIERFTAYTFHKNKYALILLLIITILSFFTFHKARFESDMDKMNYMSPELKTAEQNLNKISNDALRKMYFVVTGKTLNDALITNDKLNKKISQLQKSNIIKNYSSISYYLISDSLQQIRIRRWNNFLKKKNIDTIKHKLIKYGKNYGFKENAFNEFYSLLQKDFKPISNVNKQKLISILGNDLITEDKNLTTVVTLIKLKQEDKEEVYKKIPAKGNIYIVDKKYITDKIVNILKNDFNELVTISLLVVFVILLLYFGRIELSLITFIPMLISWLWTLSFMWLFNFEFTIFNIIISTFIFGLGIDYSIFMSRGLLQKYRFGTDNLPSYKTSVLLSAITTVTAIGVLIFAKHPAMRSIAFLSVIGILSVVFVTYTLQPVLFNFLIKQQNKMRSAPVTAKDLFFGLLVFTVFLIGSILSIIFWGLLMIIPFGKNSKKKVFHSWLFITSKAIAYIPVNVKKIINNPFNEKFNKPAVIIANHQSHIDIPLILMLHPKILILTNDWVQNNIFYGRIVKYADFYPTSNGFEKNLKLLKEKVKQGYSVLIYPEGSRSDDLKIKRFHKGAFEYAKKLEIDILPVVIQGAGDCIPKGEPFLKSGQISINILKRYSVKEFGTDSREQAKKLRKFMSEEYSKIRKEYETPAYFRKKMIANYIYKTPVLEHYTRIKTRIENNYEFFNNILPLKGHITDIGTGYGYLPYMLSFCSKERTITGIDYDCKKINTANHNISKSDNLNFICNEVLEVDFPVSDAFVINDVLHYMPKDKQKELIIKCINRLNQNGQIIIRDGNSEMKKKHKGTKLSEFFSTKLIKFNKTKYNKLHFTSKYEILEIVSEFDFEVQIVDETKFTSNIIFVLKKK